MRDPRLRFCLSFHPLFVGGNPFTTSALYGLIVHLERKGGVHYAMGGTGRLVQGLLGLIAAQGGSVRYGAEVRRVTLRGRVATGVELASGERLESDIVVSNADAAWTHGRMLPPRCAGAGATGDCDACATRWVCSSGTSAPGASTRTSDITRSWSGRATAS